MRLDLGGVTVFHSTPEGADGADQPPALDSVADIGAALKAVREFRGLSIEAIADATCVRQAYLLAIEDMRLDDLPSRPFVIGYLRAYAHALNIDEAAVVSRFRVEHVEASEPLREPLGVRSHQDPRLGVIIIVGLLIIATIVMWNVARRAMRHIAPRPVLIAVGPAPIQAAAPTRVSLGEPLPAPVESNSPAPYITPGLADAAAAGGGADAASNAARARAAAGIVAPGAPVGLASPATFQPRGNVFGNAPSGGPSVVLQARHSGTLVVRGADGKVYFARQLAAGEAYRVPVLSGLSADVADPAGFTVYVDGVLSGTLPGAITALSRLVVPAVTAQ